MFYTLQDVLLAYIVLYVNSLLQCDSTDWSVCHDGVQHDNGRYADLRHYLHGHALRILAIVLLPLQGIPRGEIISLSFLSFDLDGAVSDNPRRL